MLRLKNYSFEIRTKIVLIAMLGVIILIIGQLFRLQIIDHQKYHDLARLGQVKSLIIPAKRGLIYASDGDSYKPLVLNETVYNLFADPKVIVADRQKQIIDLLKNQLPAHKLVKNFDQLLDLKQTRYQVLATNLSRTEAQRIKDQQILGLGFKPKSIRVYPEGKLAAHVLGFVNNENKGQYGVEQQLNDRLSGKAGYLKTVTDVSDVPLTIGEDYINIEPRDGDNLVLSIDRNIQYQVEKILQKHLKKTKSKQGSIVVMDPNNGQVLAMANYPNYDPASYYKTKDIKAFNNNSTTLAYEAGSVIKTFTTAMGLNENKIKPNDYYNNRDCVMVYDRKICNLVKNQNRPLTFQTAFSYSLNTGMIEVLKRIGNGQISKSARQTMYKYFHDNYRFGEYTEIELPEAKGLIISPDQVEGNAVRYSNMTFGQGFNLTMIQAISAFSSLINGGKYYQPTIIRGVLKNNQLELNQPKIVNSSVISPKSSAQISQMLVGVRRSYTYIKDPAGFMIGGKTGTSETVVNGKYNKNQTVANYLGFGGVTNQPKYVIMVRLADSKKVLSGTIDAEPVFREISNWLINYLKLQPKGVK